MYDGGDFSTTENLISNLIKAVDPSLIVLTGDTVNPEQALNFEEFYKSAMDVITSTGIPWLWTGGQNIEGLTRDQVLGIDQQLDYKNCWSGYKWNTFRSDAKYTDEMLGYFSARIPVMDKSGKKEVFSVYAFDTEMFECGEALGLPGTNCIGSDAVSWFMN